MKDGVHNLYSLTNTHTRLDALTLLLSAVSCVVLLGHENIFHISFLLLTNYSFIKFDFPQMSRKRDTAGHKPTKLILKYSF